MVEIRRDTLQSIKNEAALSEAEQIVLEKCGAGLPAVLGEKRPEQVSGANRIRGRLIRYLLLGGCAEFKPGSYDPYIQGGWVADGLAFPGCKTPLSLCLADCVIKGELQARNAAFQALILDGSAVESLDLQGSQITSNVFLRNGFHASGEVSLSGAQIGGQLSCIKGRFKNPDGYALNAQGVTVTSDVFLRDGFHASGQVSLSGAQIGGQLEFDTGRFENPDGKALNAQNLTVRGVFFWKGMEIKSGAVDLMRASVGVLSDDMTSWPPKGRLALDGFQYDTIIGADISANTRLEWLDKNTSDRFQPQPYQQLAKVLQKLGHRGDAGRVLEAMEGRLRAQDWQLARGDIQGNMRSDFNWLLQATKYLFSFPFRWLFGYGQRPGKAVLWSLGIVTFAVVFFHFTFENGQMAPNSDIILTSDAWHHLADDSSVVNPAKAWSQSPAGTDYESFSALGYGIDLFIPLDTLGQEAAWAPSYARGWFGSIGFYLRWVIQTLGWVITAITAAALTGLIRRH